MNIIIIDDESNARAALTGMIQENFPEITIIGEAENLVTGVNLIKSMSPDLVLLDIEMPGHLGVDILDFFQPEEINFEIVFVTAYNDYALRAFELAAVDYLLKPTRNEHFAKGRFLK
ncbi:MAG: response regulator [Flavobacteriales bacterium]